MDPTVPSVSPKRRYYFFITIPLVLLTVFAVGVWRYKDAPNPFFLGMSNDVIYLTPPPAELISTDGWVTANDPTRGYTIKHPSDWKETHEYADYLITLISPDGAVKLNLSPIETKTPDQLHLFIESIRLQNNDYNETTQTVQYDFKYDIETVGANKLSLVTKKAKEAKPGYESSVYAYISNGDKVLTVTGTVDYNNAFTAKVVKTIFSTFTYDTTFVGKNVPYYSKELGVSFEYPFTIAPINTSQASSGKGGSASAGEDWVRVLFNKYGFESGYFELTASTPNYEPLSWEGSPHWFNTKISATESTESVAQKLTKAHFHVLNLEKVTNSHGVSGYKTWLLDCYTGCTLSRVVVIPMTNSRFNNLLLYGIMDNLNGQNLDAPNAGIEQAQPIADKVLKTVSEGTMEPALKENLRVHDALFDSLAFTSVM